MVNKALFKSSYFYSTLFITLTGIFISSSITIAQAFFILSLLFTIFYIYKNKIDIIHNIYFKLFLAFYIATLPSIFLGAGYAPIPKSFFSFWVYLLFFVALILIDKRNFKVVAFFFALGALALAISTFAQVIFTSVVRPGGFFRGGYMMNAHILSIASIFSFTYALSGYEKRRKFIYFFLIVFALTFFAMVLTKTRMPLVAVLISIGAVSLHLYRLKGALFFVLVLLAIISILFFGTDYLDRFSEVLKGADNPATSHGWRKALWLASWDIFKDYPLFGIGLKGFEPLAKPLMPDIAHMPLGNPHSAYITVAVNFGLVGLATFAIFIFKLVLDTFRFTRKNNLALVALSVELCFLIEGITENNFGMSLYSMQFFFIIGSVLALCIKEEAE